jgi:hypothetical protein
MSGWDPEITLLHEAHFPQADIPTGFEQLSAIPRAIAVLRLPIPSTPVNSKAVGILLF